MTGARVTAANLRTAPHLRHLYEFLLENRLLEGIRDVDESCLPIYSREVLSRLRAGDERWTEMVPPAVADLIRARGLLGCPVDTPAASTPAA
jgi:hypothetical protein